MVQNSAYRYRYMKTLSVKLGVFSFIFEITHNSQYTNSIVMPKKISSLLQREWGSSYETAVLVAIFTFIFQFAILLRDLVLAHYFGAGHLLDTYYAATRIPDLLFVLVASPMSAVVFVPIFLKHLDESETRAKKFLSDTFSVVFTTFALFSLGIFLIAPFLTRLFFASFDLSSQQQIILMMRVLLAAPLFFALSNLFGSVTQALNRFFIFALAPIFYTLGVILGAALFYPAFGPLGIALGIVAGAFLNFFVYFFISSRSGFVPTISWRPSFLDVWELVRAALPRITSLAVGQILLIILIVFASKMHSGAVSVFSMALNMQFFVLAVVGTSFIAGTFPGISRHAASEDIERFIVQITATARRIIFWSVPAVIFMIVLRSQIVRSFLGSGQFDWTATKLSIAVLVLLSVSIPAQAIVLLLARGFNVAGNAIAPFIANVCAAVLTVFGAYWLIVAYNLHLFFRNFIVAFLRINGVRDASVLMIPLAYSAGVFVAAALLVYFFRKRFAGFSMQPIRKTFSESLFASVLAGFVAYEFLVILGLYLDLHTFRGIFMQGLGGFSAGALAWWLVLELLNSEDIKEFRLVMGNKFGKVGFILPGQEEI